MSRVNWDAAAGWLTRESIVPLPPPASGDLPRYDSFDQHLEQAQKATGASSGVRPEPPAYSASPRSPESPPREHSQQSPREDRPGPPRSESAEAESRPAPTAENSAEPSSPRADDSDDSDSPHGRAELVDDRGDAEKDRDHASDVAAAAGTAAPTAQAGQDASEKTSPHGRSAKLVALHARGKPEAARVAAKEQADTSANATADPSPAAARHSKPTDASQAAVQAAAEDAASVGDKLSVADGGDVAEGNALDTSGQGQPTAAAAAEVVAKAAGGGAPATNPPTGNAAAEPVEATGKIASGVSISPEEHAAQGQLPGGGARRTGSRPGARASGEVQADPEALQAATAGEDASPDAAARPGESEAVSAKLHAVTDEPKGPDGNRSTDSPRDAKAVDPAAARDAPTRASDTGGPRNEEPAKTDAADRARFVQRVARAFESAAERAGHVRLRLHPPELGSLRLDLTIRDGQMSARMETETESARNMLLENLPALKERLAEHHIKVGSFDIECRGQDQGGLSQRSQDQSRWQPPSAGRVPRVSGSGQGGSDTEAVGGAPRRLGSSTSFDVVI